MSLTRPKYSQIYDTDWKQSVEAGTVGSDVGNLIVGNTQPSTLDGFNLSNGNRVLVKDQTDATQNGIYKVANVGTGSNGWWTRALDANQSSFVTSGLTVVVDSGTANGGKEFRLITQDPITLGSTNLVFTNQTATPGGANTQIQFFDTISGVPILSGNPGFVYSKVSNAVTMTGNLSVYGVNAIGNISTPLLNAGQINTTGNVLATNAILNALTVNGGITSTGFFNTTANISTAQLNAGQINTTGNVLATNAVLNALTVNGVTTQSGNLNVTNGNLNVTGTIWITGNILPTANVTYNLGSPTNKFKSAYFSGNTVYIGSESMGVDTSGTWQFTSNGATISLGTNVPLNPPALFATGNVTTAAVYAPFIGNTGSQLTGVIQTASQTNITQVGNLTSLSVAGASTFYSAPVITPSTNATTLGTGALIVQGGASFAKDVYVGGNLYAANVVSVNYSYLTVNDPLIYLQGNVYPYNFSIGFYGHFIGGPANTYAHTGFVRSWTNNSWYLFSNIAEPIAGNVNVSDANLIYDPLYTGSLTVTGFINANGNVMASTVNAGQINTTGNVLATNAVLNALTVNGVINASGNILAGFGVFNGLNTNNGLTVNGGWINNAGNIVATGGIFNSLTVNGLITQGITTANTATAVLTHGSDPSFQLTAQNGYNNSTGSEVARFGINYSGTGWDSFTQYIRGGAAQNGYLSFWAANAPIANVQSTGLTVTGVINASGNILSTGAVHNTLTVNGTASTNVASVASTILAGAVGVTGNIIANASVIYGNASGGYGVRQFFNPITNSLDTVFG